MSKQRVAVYVRVSSDGQAHASQEPDLERWVAANAAGTEVAWYRETFTGKTMERPVMSGLEGEVKAGRVSTLVVWRLDRLGRTAGQTLRFLDELEAAGVRFVSVRDGVDASTPTGRLLRTILAGFAEYEREVIGERIRAGIGRAKSEGRKWGGRRAGARYRLTPERLDAIKGMLSAGVSKSETARQLGLARSTVYEAVRVIEASSP